ncbi:MAG: hypothetical protein ACRD2I_20515 [Vicinamibacterales bacterium]
MRAPISAGPVTVTVTPGITAFVLSDTVPMMAPVVELTWAVANGATETIREMMNRDVNNG